MQSESTEFVLTFQRGKLVDLSQIYDHYGNQLYKYAYFSTNGEYTYLCLNCFSLPKRAVKYWRKIINGNDCYYIKVTHSSIYDEYIFHKKTISGVNILVLVEDHKKSFINNEILFVINESDFNDLAENIEIDENNNADYLFDFPARHDSSLIPKIISTESNIKPSPNIKKVLKSFGHENKFRRPIRQQSFSNSSNSVREQNQFSTPSANSLLQSEVTPIQRSLRIEDLDNENNNEGNNKKRSATVKVSHLRKQTKKGPNKPHSLPEHLVNKPIHLSLDENMKQIEDIRNAIHKESEEIKKIHSQIKDRTSISPIDMQFSTITPISSKPSKMDSSTSSKHQDKSGPSFPSPDNEGYKYF